MRPLAPATNPRPQHDLTGRVRFWLYDLTAAIPGHPAGSTVSDATLLAAGYRLPEVPR